MSGLATATKQPLRLPFYRRRALYVVASLAVVAGTAFVLVRFDRPAEAVGRIEHGNPELLALAVILEALSFAGYVVVTRAAFRPEAPRIGWRESAEITLAGVVATRALATGGAGGIALTVWALRAAGMDARTAARQLTGFLIAVYSFFFFSLFLVSVGLATNLVPGYAPTGLAFIGALVGAAVIVLALALFVAPGDIESRTRRAARGRGRVAWLAERLATVPAVAHEGTRVAVRILRRGRSTLAGVAAWWAFDIAVLAVCFGAFGPVPALAPLVLCYFLGQVANVIPTPGGVGAVEAGTIGCFAACGVPLDLAVLGVLSYKAISTWLPVLPGLYGYWRLRRTVEGWRLREQEAPA